MTAFVIPADMTVMAEAIGFAHERTKGIPWAWQNVIENALMRVLHPAVNAPGGICARVIQRSDISADPTFVLACAACRTPHGILVRMGRTEVPKRDLLIVSGAAPARRVMGEWVGTIEFTQTPDVTQRLEATVRTQAELAAMREWILAGEGPDIEAIRAERAMGRVIEARQDARAPKAGL